LGSPAGPEVLPGQYKIALKTPGAARALTGEVTVEGDPRVTFSDADRRARQASLLSLYDLQKTLGGARASARALTAQIAAIKRDLTTAGGSRPATGSDGAALLDKVADRASQMQGDVERQLNSANQVARAVEGYSGLPTDDQRRQVDWAYEDATTAIRGLNQLLETDVPALYTQLTQQQVWPRRVPPVALPVRKTSSQ
jgi:hypothetical protein